MKFSVYRIAAGCFRVEIFHRACAIVFALGLIALFLLPRTGNIHAAGTTLLGDVAVETSKDSDAAGVSEAFQTTATTSGTVGSISVYVDTSTTVKGLIVGLYSNSSGRPLTLLSQGSSTAAIASGAWNTVAIPPVAVSANSIYWIAILGTGGVLNFRDGGSNCLSFTSAQNNLTALPSSWSSGQAWSSCRLSAYGSATSSGPILSISNSGISFSANQGGANPAPASISVTNTGTGGTLGFTTASDAAWLSATPTSGSTPGNVQISAATGVLTASTYTGHISVTAAGAQSSPATITVTFTVVPAATYGISGTVSPSGTGTTLTLSGAASASAAADASGNYGFSGLANGSYTVTPSKAGFTFSPASAPVTLSNSSDASVNFTATPVPTFSISGTISPSGSGTTVSLSGAATATTVADGSGNYSFAGLANGTYMVTPFKASFGFSPANAPETVSNASISGVNFTATPSSSGQTIFTTQAPALLNETDGAGVNYELGTTFTSGTAGQITAIRFWKASGESGAHTGRVWATSGQLLTTVTFASETTSGWQEQALPTPLSVAANTRYVVTVNTGNAFYVATNGGLSSAVVNGSLSTIVGSNGLYGSVGNFPTSTWENSNYFRDIVFVSGTGATTPVTFTISGSINPAAGGSGATVTLSGAGSATTTANGSGNYSFPGISNGSYTVTPTKTGFTFSPTSQAANVNGANLTVGSFTATAIPPATFTISGTITPAASASGATVTLSGAGSATTTANASGNYSFTGMANGSYTVTPTKTGFTFSPTSQAANVNGANLTVGSFTATAIPPATFTISGTITPAASASGATVTLSGAGSATTTANASGNYSFTGMANGSYTVTPTKTGFTFSPTSQAANVNGANLTVGSFTATAIPPATFTISGTITPAASASGATVTLSGAGSATTTANASGNYSFTGMANGSYTVTPTKTGFTFSPTSQAANVNGANLTVGSFTATAIPPATFTISGTITPAASGSGAVVTLGGPTTATTTANASGNFTFTGLANGTYTMMPDKAGFSFSPTVQGATVNGANVTGINFTATVSTSTFTISGTISPATSGNGATVNLSGNATATTTANSSGNFSFAGLASGNYTVTPVSSTATFTPTNQSVTVGSSNVTGVNFTASSVFFFDDFLGNSLSSSWAVMNRHGDYSNNELECYLPANVVVSGGFLTINALVQNQTCGDSLHSAASWKYTSGMVQWKSLSFTYGTVEYRAKMAGGTGTWPAIWLLGVNCEVSNVASADNISPCNWPEPGSDEIDVTEILGSAHTSINQEIHSVSHNDGCSASTSDVSQNYHVYDLVWSPGKLVWKVDGTTTCTINQSYVPSTPMFLIINDAIGGSGGSPNNSTFPQAMSVDYIKVTQP